uniref:Uncharacterized protein n=1 Tax=Anopheles coluzzii TaxID=1518534 RepID=A0A8W7P1Z0_ANOCL
MNTILHTIKHTVHQDDDARNRPQYLLRPFAMACLSLSAGTALPAQHAGADAKHGHHDARDTHSTRKTHVAVRYSARHRTNEAVNPSAAEPEALRYMARALGPFPSGTGEDGAKHAVLPLGSRVWLWLA